MTGGLLVHYKRRQYGKLWNAKRKDRQCKKEFAKDHTDIIIYISLIIVIILILNGKELNDQYKVLLMSLLCVETIHFENLSPSRRLRVDCKLRINDRMSHVLIRY